MRDTHLDSLRGFLMLLVVLGHALQVITNEGMQGRVFKIIYSFHMPAFFVLSGYLSYGRVLTWRRVLKKIIHLTLPFFSWAVIDLVVVQQRGFCAMICDLVESPTVGLWFLWVLACCWGVYYLCSSFISKVKLARLNVRYDLPVLLFVCASLIFGLKGFLSGKAFGVDMVSYFFIYFCFGHLLAYRMSESASGGHSKMLLAICISVLLLGVYLLNEHMFTNLIIKITLGFSISYILLKAFRSVRPFEILVAIGRVTLGIYAIHIFFIVLIRDVLCFRKTFEGVIGLLISIVVMIALLLASVACERIIRKNRISSFLLLGE